MARRRALSAREVDALREVGMHWISDNLYLQIREQGTRSWLFRYWVDGKPKVIGLGATRDVTLAEARDRADRLRIEIRDGGALRVGKGLHVRREKPSALPRSPPRYRRLRNAPGNTSIPTRPVGRTISIGRSGARR